jgi:hypothetical protein
METIYFENEVVYIGNNQDVLNFFKHDGKIYLFAYGSLSRTEIEKESRSCNEVTPIIFGKGRAPNARRVFCNREGTGVATLIKDNNNYVLGTIYEFDPVKNMKTFIKILKREGQNFNKRKYTTITKDIVRKINEVTYLPIKVIMFVIDQTSLDTKIVENNVVKKNFKLARKPSEEYRRKVLEQLNQSGWTMFGGLIFSEIPDTGETYGMEYNRIQYE